LLAENAEKEEIPAAAPAGEADGELPPPPAAAAKEDAEETAGDDPEAAAEAPEGAEDAEGSQGADADIEADAHEQNTEANAAAPKEPVKLGYRTFKSGTEAANYIKNILTHSRPDQPLNEVSLSCSSFRLSLSI
jgi:hypothetical protein